MYNCNNLLTVYYTNSMTAHNNRTSYFRDHMSKDKKITVCPFIYNGCLNNHTIVCAEHINNNENHKIAMNFLNYAGGSSDDSIKENISSKIV